jgi:hypothetical protein
VGATVFAAGFVVSTVGVMLYASVTTGLGFESASAWLESDWQLALALASACGAVAFFSSWATSDQGDSPDLAVLPDPA